MRQYPQIPILDQTPKRKISFVTVHFCDEIDHNLLRSSCIHDPQNELIIVDNRGNCFFDNLSKAINYGVRQAKHELIAIIHEDVFLLDGWQQHFETSLSALESEDPDWYVLGSLGFDKNDQLHGHCSYPYQYINDLAPYSFREIDMLDELLMIFKKSTWIDLDEAVPSIHFIGRYIVTTGRAMGRKTYLIDAPTIHKYATRYGELINVPNESEKITHRESLPFKAEYDISKEYLEKQQSPKMDEPETKHVSPSVAAVIESPVVFLAHNLNDARLLLALVQGLGIYIGTSYNSQFGDSRELTMAMYKAIIRKYRCDAEWQKKRNVPELKMVASNLLDASASAKAWGFLFIENFYLFPEILSAFPSARFVYLKNAKDENLGEADLIAALDNEIGRITLPLAYDHAQRPRAEILSDPVETRIRQTRLHQIEQMQEFMRSHDLPYLEINSDDLLQNPSRIKGRLSQFLKIRMSGWKIDLAILLKRVSSWVTNDKPSLQ